jgi:hypothetical protein
VSDWTIPAFAEEPADFWSQSFCYGSVELSGLPASSVQVRFRNDGGKKILRAEAHWAYRLASNDATRVTFDWTATGVPRRESNTFPAGKESVWELATGEDVRTRWVEFSAVSP